MKAYSPHPAVIHTTVQRHAVAAGRRPLLAGLGTLLAMGLMAGPASAFDISALSQGQAVEGVRTALSKAAETAVQQLGAPGGFLGNPRVRIPLPGALEKAKPLMSMMMGKERFDELETGINRAAEGVMPLAKPILVDAVRNMSIEDAKGLLSGGEHSATDFFQRTAGKKIQARIQPLVAQQVERIGLAQQYNALAGEAAKFGVVNEDDARIEQYVARKAVDGLFTTVADQEAAIRRDPVGTGSDLLKKIFTR